MLPSKELKGFRAKCPDQIAPPAAHRPVLQYLAVARPRPVQVLADSYRRILTRGKSKGQNMASRQASLRMWCDPCCGYFSTQASVESTMTPTFDRVFLSQLELGHYLCNSLNAWLHWLCKKPGIHHNMAKGSIARAASAPPISAGSKPNCTRMRSASFFASLWLPQ